MNNQLNTIAVDLTPILPGGENGGAKIFVLELLHQLAELAPEIQFILLTQSASHEELSSLDRHNIRRLMISDPEIAQSFCPGSFGLTMHLHADLLFCPFTAPTYAEPGVATVCTIYDLQYKTYPEFFTAEDVIQRATTFENACGKATMLTAISDYSKNSAITHGCLAPDKIHTIYLNMAQRIVPGINHDKTILERLSLSPRQYFLYPANFWKHKNHEMLLTAFNMACHEQLPPEVKLVCTGAQSPRQKWLKSAVNAMNLEDRVLFPGYISTAELATLLTHCTSMVFPSLYEGFGLPVIEAMAAGIPVACSNTTSLPEIAGDAALFFDPRIPTQIAHALITVANNGLLRTRLIQKGLQRAAHFQDTKHMAQEYLALFQQAFDKEKAKTILSGVFNDGWVSSCLNVQVASAKNPQTLEVELSAPKCLPHSKITVQTYKETQPQGNAITFKRGTDVTLSIPIESKGGIYKISLSPTFVPFHTGLGQDTRDVSAILLRCGIAHTNVGYNELFSQTIPK